MDALSPEYYPLPEQPALLRPESVNRSMLLAVLDFKPYEGGEKDPENLKLRIPPKDDKRRRALLQLARDGYAPAMYFYAEWSRTNDKIENAVVWHRQAAEQGMPEAMVKLGGHLETGIGTKDDPVQAAGWYRKAAEKGHAEGADQYARVLRIGIGVPQDRMSAREYSKKAQNLRHPPNKDGNVSKWRQAMQLVVYPFRRTIRSVSSRRNRITGTEPAR